MANEKFKNIDLYAQIANVGKYAPNFGKENLCILCDHKHFVNIETRRMLYKTCFGLGFISIINFIGLFITNFSLINVLLIITSLICICLVIPKIQILNIVIEGYRVIRDNEPIPEGTVTDGNAETGSTSREQ